MPVALLALATGAFGIGTTEFVMFLGGIVINAGLGYTAVNWVGAALTASAIILLVVSAQGAS
jgi:MFS transporter, DHA1 family, inner membrane transport protein